MARTLDVKAAEAALRMNVRGGAALEPEDDLCPPWWPRRPRAPGRRARACEAHVDVRAADRVYLALSLLATTFEISDRTLAREVRDVALAHIRDAASVLARGAAQAWDRCDDVCPPWPWARPPAAPGRAADLLDALCLLHTYNLAAKIDPASAREAATSAIGRALVDHATAVTRAFA